MITYKCNKIILNYFVNEFKKMNKSALEEKIKQIEQMESLSLEHIETVKIKDDNSIMSDLLVSLLNT